LHNTEVAGINFCSRAITLIVLDTPLDTPKDPRLGPGSCVCAFSERNPDFTPTDCSDQSCGLRTITGEMKV
jgi:hypothetical protein